MITMLRLFQKESVMDVEVKKYIYSLAVVYMLHVYTCQRIYLETFVTYSPFSQNLDFNQLNREN